MTRSLITEQEFVSNFTLAEGFGNSNPIRFKSKTFDFYLEFEPIHRDMIFEDCEFQYKVLFTSGPEIIRVTNDPEEQQNIFSPNETNLFKEKVGFISCDFQDLVQFSDIDFDSKFKMQDCTLNAVSFHNTTFNALADFWKTTFQKPITFYKTDFNATVVFSMATFEENVLFTYSLLAAKSIFARTHFKKGLDLSQAIISGDLKLFDLRFNFLSFEGEYVGLNDEDYQDFIGNQHKIPLINKIHTLQILKNQFEKDGNFETASILRREEKNALRVFNCKKINTGNSKVNNTRDKENKQKIGLEDLKFFFKELRTNDGFILAFNRWSNDYRTSFFRGIRFTFTVAVIFGFLTLLSTNVFWKHINNLCFDSSFDEVLISSGVEFIFNFLNPVHKITYLHYLKPFYGVSYFLDFLGRVAVGYGIYQTVQAFRKFR